MAKLVLFLSSLRTRNDSLLLYSQMFSFCCLLQLLRQEQCFFSPTL